MVIGEPLRVLGVKGFHLVDDMLDRPGLVVFGEDEHGHGRAITVQQARGGGELRQQQRHRIGVTRQDARVDMPLVKARVHQLHVGGQAQCGLHAVGVLHLPQEAVHLLHGVVEAAGLGVGFGHDLEDVHAQVEVLDDGRRVLVVARVGAQFRHTLLRITHLQVGVLVQRKGQQYGADQQRDDGRATSGDLGQEPEQPGEQGLFLGLLGLELVHIANRHVGQPDRHHHFVGDNDRGHTKGRVQRHFANDVDGDQVDRGKARHIGNQRRGAGDGQAAEGFQRSVIAVLAGGDFVHPGVDVLHPVGDRHRQHQKGHQNRERVQPVACGGQQAEFPDHRHDGAGQWQKRQLER